MEGIYKNIKEVEWLILKFMTWPNGELELEKLTQDVGILALRLG